MAGAKKHSVLWFTVGAVGVVALYSAHMRRMPPPLFIRDELPFGHNAMTVPPVGVFVAKRHLGNKRLMLHELQHWKQFQRQGLVKFYYRYFSDLVKHGYDGSPMEKEARQAAGECEGCQNYYTECVRNGFSCTVHEPNFRMR